MVAISPSLITAALFVVPAFAIPIYQDEDLYERFYDEDLEVREPLKFKSTARVGGKVSSGSRAAAPIAPLVRELAYEGELFSRDLEELDVREPLLGNLLKAAAIVKLYKKLTGKDEKKKEGEEVEKGEKEERFFDDLD